MDVMAINKIPFMITTSRDIYFGMADLFCDKTWQMIMQSIQQISREYGARGLRIQKY